MALNFPAAPVDGELYPNPAEPGVQQYIYNATKGTWLTVFQGLQKISAKEPIYLTGPEATPTVNIRDVTQQNSGAMSAADKIKLDGIPANAGTMKSITAGIGLGAPDTGDVITEVGTINLLPPTPVYIGGVKAGPGVGVTTGGSLTLLAPSSVSIGGVKQGKGLSIATDGTISIAPGGTFTVLDSIQNFFDGNQTQFTMTVNSIPFAPASTNALLIFIGGIPQTPNVAFTTDLATILFTSAPPTGATFYGIALS